MESDIRMIALDHIALIVSSEKSIQFYGKLGFKETKRIERSYDTVVFMQCGQIVLEIFIDSNHPERVTEPETNGLRHIALLVENLTEVMKVIECKDISSDWFGRKFIFTKDPDGQPIELIERKADIGLDSYKIENKWVQENREQFDTEPSFI